MGDWCKRTWAALFPCCCGVDSGTRQFLDDAKSERLRLDQLQREQNEIANIASALKRNVSQHKEQLVTLELSTDKYERRWQSQLDRHLDLIETEEKLFMQFVNKYNNYSRQHYLRYERLVKGDANTGLISVPALARHIQALLLQVREALAQPGVENPSSEARLWLRYCGGMLAGVMSLADVSLAKSVRLRAIGGNAGEQELADLSLLCRRFGVYLSGPKSLVHMHNSASDQQFQYEDAIKKQGLFKYRVGEKVDEEEFTVPQGQAERQPLLTSTEAKSHGSSPAPHPQPSVTSAVPEPSPYDRLSITTASVSAPSQHAMTDGPRTSVSAHDHNFDGQHAPVRSAAPPVPVSPDSKTSVQPHTELQHSVGSAAFRRLMQNSRDPDVYTAKDEYQAAPPLRY